MSDLSGSDPAYGETAQDRNWAQARQTIDDLTNRVNELSAKAEKADRYERESLFRDVGLDLSKPAVQDFIKAYEGDQTPEAIREAAQVRGHIEAPAPEIPPEHQAALAAIQEASVDSTPAMSGDTTDLLNQINSATNQEQLQAILDAHGLSQQHQ